jgi:hypothetical protein
MVYRERHNRAEDFNDIGLSLYGHQWQSELARKLGVSSRTVRRWSAGEPVPDTLREALRIICDEKRKEMMRNLRWLNHPDAKFSNGEHDRVRVTQWDLTD